MKRFVEHEEQVHILSSPIVEEQQSKGLDITKLLQILPKLNLKSLFPNTKQQVPSPQPENYQPTVNFMANHNKATAIDAIERHKESVKRLHNS